MQKTSFYFLFLVILLSSCSTQKKTQSLSLNSSSSSGQNIQPLADQKTADGSSYEKAIFIDKNNSSAGIDAEYVWLKENYPGYQMISQSLNSHNKRYYDLLKIKTKEGVEKTIYFDISKFFGKW